MTTVLLKENLGIRRILNVRNELVDIYNTAQFYGNVEFEDTKQLYQAIKIIDKFMEKQGLEGQ